MLLLLFILKVGQARHQPSPLEPQELQERRLDDAVMPYEFAALWRGVS